MSNINIFIAQRLVVVNAFVVKLIVHIIPIFDKEIINLHFVDIIAQSTLEVT